MQKKLTITVDSEVYDGLHAVVGRRRISRFINDLARPLVVGHDLRAGYAAMAADEERETEAEEWCEGLIEDVADEPSRHGPACPTPDAHIPPTLFAYKKQGFNTDLVD
jgi:hypothetical protein